jgi:hypothetical protein
MGSEEKRKTNDDIAHRLDKVIAILQLAHRDEIERARIAIRSDPVNAALLDAAAKETPAAKLAKLAQTKTKQSSRTVARRIAELVEARALEKIGAGSATTYKATGLI